MSVRESASTSADAAAGGPGAAAPKLSIVIPIYNEEGILHSAVVDLIERMSQVAAQDPRFDSYELLLSENGSTDSTVAVATELAARYPQVRIDSLDGPTMARR